MSKTKQQRRPSKHIERKDDEHVKKNPVKRPHITAKQAQQAKAMKRKLRMEFVKEINEKRSGMEEKEQQFKPTTKALVRVKEAVEHSDKDIQKMIVHKNESLPSALPALPAPLEPATTAEIETQTEEITSLGPITVKYIRRVPTKRPDVKTFSDRYGMYSDMATSAYMIGNKEVMIQDDDYLIIGDKKNFNASTG